jgi:hypothetical protein
MSDELTHLSFLESSDSMGLGSNLDRTTINKQLSDSMQAIRLLQLRVPSAGVALNY